MQKILFFLLFSSFAFAQHLPKHFAPAERKKGFLNGEQTTHWCDRYILVDINGPKRVKIPNKYKELISDI